jgi:hypothetical protein
LHQPIIAFVGAEPRVVARRIEPEALAGAFRRA